MTIEQMVKLMPELEKKLMQFNPDFRARIDMIINDMHHYYMGQSMSYIESDISDRYGVTFFREIMKIDFTITLAKDNVYETKAISLFGDSYRVAIRLEIE